MTAAELEDAFGEPVTGVGERNWPELASRMRDYVLLDERAPIESYDAIRGALDERWGIPVVETDYTVGSMGPLEEADPAYGRCGVRLLDLLGQTAVYVVIRRSGEGRGGRMLWALLHELGHFVNHFDLLLSLSVLYHRICLNPPLEMEVGGFARRAAMALNVRHEREADLFAVNWLMPPWTDSDEAVRVSPHVPAGLTPDGYRLHRLRRALGAALQMPSAPADIERLNRAGAGEKNRSRGPYPHEGSPWSRASWILFNREELREEAATALALDADYYKVVGYPSRFVRELKQRPAEGRPFDPSLAWLRRVEPENVVDVVDAVRWAPILVPSPAPGHPDFHIPVRPVPSKRDRDSELGWVHMNAPSVSRPRPLSEWIAEARAQEAGLLLFPRNPAERALDARGVVRG